MHREKLEFFVQGLEFRVQGLGSSNGDENRGL